jgi:hypothetical protein
MVGRAVSPSLTLSGEIGSINPCHVYRGNRPLWHLMLRQK